MIRGAFQHFPGIGARRLGILQEAGIRSWHDLARQPRHLLGLGQKAWDDLNREIEQCERALAAEDLTFLVNRLRPADHWRILSNYLDRCSYFDIETTGLGYDSEITVISCLHEGQLQTYVNGENLPDFLELLDAVSLLVSFNGNSFDVPQVTRAFNIPQLPCSHLDLRWACYHQRLTGGLKEVERQLGIERPPELQGVGGAEAVILWNRWALLNDAQARQLLIKYCNADVIALRQISQALLNRGGVVADQASDCCSADLWYDLSEGDPCLAAPTDTPPAAQPSAPAASAKRNAAAARLQEHLRQRRRRG